jgi:aldose 1-epimerase
MPSRPDLTERLSVGDVVLDIDLARGARATRWRVGDLSLLGTNGTDPAMRGMYPMAPWAGRLRGNALEWAGRHVDLPVTFPPWALHGTTLRQPATVIDSDGGSEWARLVARIEDHPGWPWPMAVDVGWELRGRSLTTTITVHALAEPFPAVAGWHPWFRRQLDRGDPLEWSLDATARLERGADHLPTGRRLAFDPSDGPFDDAFEVPDGRASLRWPGALALDVESDGGWYVVYDEVSACVCVEPQSGPPDGLRDGVFEDVSGGTRGWSPAIAAPGRPHSLTTTWTLRPLP